MTAMRSCHEPAVRARHLSVRQVTGLVHRYTHGRQWGFLGEPSVNVLDLNLALDRLTRAAGDGYSCCSSPW